MNNKEFSELAKKVYGIAKEKAIKKAGNPLKYMDFLLDIKDDQFGPRMAMWFHGKNGVVFHCDYDMKKNEFKGKL